MLVILAGFCHGPLQAQRNRDNSVNVRSFLQRLDLNRNNYLDPAETKGQTQQLLQKYGLDPNRSHKIDTIAELIKNNGRNPKDEASGRNADRKVPGFGVESEIVGVPDFSPTGEERMSVAAMRTRFGDSVMAQVDRTMQRYDTDKSGILEPNEVARARWRNPSAAESDTNKDGSLTRLELAYRYHGREDAALKGKSRAVANSPTSNRTGATRSTSNRSTATSRGSRTTSGSSPSRNSRRSSSASSKSRSPGFNSGNDAYDRYAEGLLKNYDKDKDQKLSKAELKEMRRPPQNADKNRDGFVDKSELVESIMRKSGVEPDRTAAATDSPAKSESKTPGDRLRRPAAATYNQSDSVFGGKDLNNDGQLQMAEFSDEWDEETINEFEEKDSNNDGVITEKEWRGKSRPSR
jgi:hypothetical protein